MKSPIIIVFILIPLSGARTATSQNAVDTPLDFIQSELRDNSLEPEAEIKNSRKEEETKTSKRLDEANGDSTIGRTNIVHEVLDSQDVPALIRRIRQSKLDKKARNKASRWRSSYSSSSRQVATSTRNQTPAITTQRSLSNAASVPASSRSYPSSGSASTSYSRFSSTGSSGGKLSQATLGAAESGSKLQSFEASDFYIPQQSSDIYSSVDPYSSSSSYPSISTYPDSYSALYSSSYLNPASYGDGYSSYGQNAITSGYQGSYSSQSSNPVPLPYPYSNSGYSYQAGYGYSNPYQSYPSSYSGNPSLGIAGTNNSYGIGIDPGLVTYNTQGIISYPLSPPGYNGLPSSLPIPETNQNPSFASSYPQPLPSYYGADIAAGVYGGYSSYPVNPTAPLYPCSGNDCLVQSYQIPPQVIRPAPIYEPPQIIQLPPIVRPPQIIQSPPIVQPPKVIESPPIFNPPKVIDPPPIVNPPKYIDSPPIYRPPEIIQPPPIYRPAEVIQPPPIMNPPEVIQSPPIIEPPKVIESPPIYKPPEIIQPPPIYRPAEVIQPPPIIKPPQIISSPPIYAPPEIITSAPIIKPPQIIQSPPIYKPPEIINSPPIIKPPEIITSRPIIQPPEIITSRPIIQPPEIITSRPIIQPPEIITSRPIIKPPEIITSRPIIRPPQIIQSPPIIKPPEVITSRPIIRPPQIIQSPPIIRPPEVITSRPIIRPPVIIPSRPIVSPPQLISPPAIVRPPQSVCPQQPYTIAGGSWYGNSQYRPPCLSHSSCSGSSMCCFGQQAGSTQCILPTTAYTNLRTYRDIQVNSTTPENVTSVELFIGGWADKGVTTLLTDYLLPINMDFSEKIDFSIWAYSPEQRKGMSCTAQDTNCVLGKLLSCVVDIEQENQLNSLSDSQDSLPKRRKAETDNKEGEENLPKQRSIPEASQSKMLSFIGCLLQSMQAGMSRRKGSVLLATKRCVRAHQYSWPDVRHCASYHHQNAETDEIPDFFETPTVAVELAVNENPVPVMDNMALSFCLSLNKAGVIPIHCELLYDTIQNERITSAENLITPEDERYPVELLINSLDELIEQEEEAIRKAREQAAESEEGSNNVTSNSEP